MTKSADNKPKSDSELHSAVQFDMVEFEERLSNVRQEFHEELKQSVVYKEPEQVDAPLNFNIPEPVQAITEKVQKSAPAELRPQSNLLASLALEAKQSQQSKARVDQNKQAVDLSVHEALDRAYTFFLPFVRHVNEMEPAINRIYRLDARSVFANLKWQGGLVDSRKHGLNDSSFRSYVAFSVNFLAPEPIFLKRPWGQFEALKKELHNLKLSTQDDIDVIHKRPKQEWLETYLDPALPVQIIFQGNYSHGKVDLLTRNLLDFGQAAYSVVPENISAEFLDELGLFLMGRTDKLPALMIKTE